MTTASKVEYTQILLDLLGCEITPKEYLDMLEHGQIPDDWQTRPKTERWKIRNRIIELEQELIELKEKLENL